MYNSKASTIPATTHQMFSLDGEYILDDGAVGVFDGRRFDGDLPQKSVHLQHTGVNIVHLAAKPGT